MVKTFLANIGVVLVAMAALAAPIASADQCTVTATFFDGTVKTFTVNVPSGTRPIDMLPLGTPPVQSVTANCQAATTPAGTPPPPSGTTSVSTAGKKSSRH